MVSDNRCGQPTKLTSELQAAICASLKVGASKEAAAGAAGIAEKTLYNWINWGEKGDERYVAFLQAVRKAEAEVEQGCLQRIFSDSAWQSAAWVLERKWANRWALRKPTEEQTQAAQPTVIYVNTGEEKDKLIAQLQNRLKAIEEGSPSGN